MRETKSGDSRDRLEKMIPGKKMGRGDERWGVNIMRGEMRINDRS